MTRRVIIPEHYRDECSLCREKFSLYIRVFSCTLPKTALFANKVCRAGLWFMFPQQSLYNTLMPRVVTVRDNK